MDKNNQSSIDNHQSPRPLPLTDIERAILFPPPRPMIDEWMAEHYRLPSEISDEPGPWQMDYVPFFAEPLRRLSHPPVKVGIEGCTQIGKTILMVGVFCYVVDCDPAPTLFLMPRETDVERRINTRIKPTFRDSPRLLNHVQNRDIRNINIGKETVFDRMIAYLAWSNSPASMADNSICNVLIDEPGKFELTTTGEDPFDLTDKRQRGYKLRCRTLYATSPQNKNDLADKQFRAGSDGRLFVPCALCGCWHEIQSSTETLILEKNADGRFFEPEAYTLGSAKCWYQCPHCKKRWTESRRASAVAKGVWVHKQQQMMPAGQIIGSEPVTRHWTYRVNSMMIHPRFWTVEQEGAELARAMREMQAGSPAALRDYRRNQQAMPDEVVGKTVDTESLMEKVTERPMGTVPLIARILTAGVDYHEDEMGNVRVEWKVKYWGEDLRQGVVAVGYAASLDEMFRMVCGQSWPWEEPTDRPELTVVCGMVDSGYQPNDPKGDGVIDVVYDFCLRYQRTGIWMPSKGAKPNQIEDLVYKDLDKVVAEAKLRYRRKYAGQYRGMKLVLINVNKFKSRVMTWAQAPLGAPASEDFPAGLPEEYWKSFNNEHLIQEGKGHWVWQPKQGHAASESHKLDIDVCASAAGWHVGVNKMYSQEAMSGPQSAMDRRFPVRTRPPDAIVRKTERAIRTKY